MARTPSIKGAAELAMLFRRALPNVDADALANRLLRRHGSLASVLEQSPVDLMQAEGIPQNAAQMITLIPQLQRYLSRADVAQMKTIQNVRDAGRFLCAQYIGVHYERMHLLCLDQNGQLLKNAQVTEGTIDETPFYLRNLFEVAARSNARALVLSHNHPSGTAHTSKQDVDATCKAIDTFSQLGIVLLDHIIVADGAPYSIHQEGDIPREIFLRQDRDNALLQNWLKKTA